MNTRKIVRPANITAADAEAQLKEAGFELVELRLIDKSGVKVASADAVGRSDLDWEATIKEADFPFEKDGDEGGEEPKDDAPDFSGEPDMGDEGDEPKDDEPKDEGADSKILDLVKEIAKHLGIPVPGEEGDEDPMAPEGEGIELPGLDAPEEPAPDAPLPLPVEKKTPGAGGGVFASHIVVANSDAIKGRRSFVACVAGASILNDGEIVNEAHIAFPGYRVAGQIDRKTLAESNEARVPLIAEGPES